MEHRDRAVVQAGWIHAPWLPKEVQEEFLRNTPVHLRDARSKGIPTIGSGNIYQTSLDDILVDPFPLRRDMSYMYAMDVGWNRTAVVFGALSALDDILYLWSEHYVAHAPPAVHVESIRARFRGWGWEPRGVIDPNSRGRSQSDGTQLLKIYRNEMKLKLIEADNSVEAGITAVDQRLQAGRLKVFRSLSNWQNEYMNYKRDLKGKVVKEHDHLMDATRYMVLGLRHAQMPPMKQVTGTGGLSGRDYGV